MSAISLRLPDDIEARLNEEARLEQRSRSEIARAAIVEYLERRERERFMAELVREARIAYGDPDFKREVLEIAEEGVELSNEALDIAKGERRASPGRKNAASGVGADAAGRGLGGPYESDPRSRNRQDTPGTHHPGRCTQSL